MARPKKRFDRDAEEGEIVRAPLPRGKQVIGLVEERMGYGKSRVRCMDGKLRLCRIPGARRRDLWIRPGSIVLVEPWDIQGDEKGDIVYQYRKAQIEFLKREGVLKDLIGKEF